LKGEVVNFEEKKSKQQKKGRKSPPDPSSRFRYRKGGRNFTSQLEKKLRRGRGKGEKSAISRGRRKKIGGKASHRNQDWRKNRPTIYQGKVGSFKKKEKRDSLSP